MERTVHEPKAPAPDPSSGLFTANSCWNLFHANRSAWSFWYFFYLNQICISLFLSLNRIAMHSSAYFLHAVLEPFHSSLHRVGILLPQPSHISVALCQLVFFSYQYCFTHFLRPRSLIPGSVILGERTAVRSAAVACWRVTVGRLPGLGRDEEETVVNILSRELSYLYRSRLR